MAKNGGIQVKAEWNYFLVEGFISSEFAQLVDEYILFLWKTGNLMHLERTTGSKSWTVYGDKFTEYLLDKYQEEASSLVGEVLLPGYSWVNHYRKGDALRPHTDRAASEVGVSVVVGPRSVIDWPLFIRIRENEAIAVNCNPGDAIFFNGQRHQHWRLKLEEEYCSVVNLFFVRKYGEQAELVYDGRDSLGKPLVKK